MNINLSADLRRFVERNVKDGGYESTSDIVGTALRLLQSRDRLLRSATVCVDSSLSKLWDGDIESIVALVMMQAKKDMDEDLKMIVDEVKAMTAAKSKVRELIRKVHRDIVSNAGQCDSKESLKFPLDGMGSEQVEWAPEVRQPV